MKDNEVVMLLRSYILSGLSPEKLANLALSMRQSHENLLSEKLQNFLLDIMSMDAGPEFTMSNSYMLNELWDILSLREIDTSFMHGSNEFLYSPEEGLNYFLPTLESKKIPLSEIVDECKYKFKFNDFQTLCFIYLFIDRLNNKKDYTDVTKRWFINPEETEKDIEFVNVVENTNV